MHESFKNILGSCLRYDLTAVLTRFQQLITIKLSTFSNLCTTSTCPKVAAWISGVFDSSSLASGNTPCSRRVLTSTTSPFSAACNNALPSDPKLVLSTLMIQCRPPQVNALIHLIISKWHPRLWRNSENKVQSQLYWNLEAESCDLPGRQSLKLTHLCPESQNDLKPCIFLENHDFELISFLFYFNLLNS